jgi:hypothetical protein
MYGMLNVMKPILDVRKIQNICILYILCCSVVLIPRPLTILFIVGHFPSPSQTFILNQMTGLIERGHNVLIYSFQYHFNASWHPDIIKYGLLDRLMYNIFTGDLPECDIIFCQFGYLGKKIIESPRLEKWLKGKKIVTCLRGADTTSRLKKNPHL